MSDYTNTFNGAAKDATEATIVGTDFDTEFDNVATMSATKANKVGTITVGTLATLTSTGDLADGGVVPSAYIKTVLDDADAGAAKDTLLLSTSVTITPASDADVTLSSTQATYGRLILVDGSWASGHNIIVPTNQRRYWVDNTAGTYDAVVKTSGGTGITVPAGYARVVVCDGTNVINPLDYYDQLFQGGAVTSTATQALTSGTTKDFTIPTWAKVIKIAISGMSTNGTSGIELTIGDSGGIETTGYLGSIVRTGAATLATANHPTDAFTIVNDLAAADILHGIVTLSLVDAATFTWAIEGNLSESNASTFFSFAGSKALSAALTTVRLQTTNGTDTFDAGSAVATYY